MKRLFLTSAGLQPEVTEDFLKFLNKEPKDARLCFIATASNLKESKPYVKEDMDRLEEIGFKVTELDIENESEASLDRKLEGFDKALNKFLDRGGIYIGVSAGSMIAGLNIESAVWKHHDVNMVGLKDLTGLKLVPFVISAHIDESNINIIRKAAEKTGYPIIALSDKQAVLVEDDKQRIVGMGDKIVFNIENKI